MMTESEIQHILVKMMLAVDGALDEIVLHIEDDELLDIFHHGMKLIEAVEDATGKTALEHYLEVVS